LLEVEAAQRNEASAARQLFELVQRIDRNVENVSVRVSAPETNFSLLSAATSNLATRVELLERRVEALDRRVEALERKVDVRDRKLDQVLGLLQHPRGSQPH
jgi:chromosome segregation ATPase